MTKERSHKEETPSPETKICECCINIRALISVGILLLAGYFLLRSINLIDDREIPKQLGVEIETPKGIFRWPIVVLMTLGVFIAIGESIKCTHPLIEELIKKIFKERENPNPPANTQITQITNLFNSKGFTAIGATGVVLGVVLSPSIHGPDNLQKNLPLAINLQPTVTEGPPPKISLTPQILVTEVQASDIPVTFNIKPKLEGAGEIAQMIPNTIKITVDDDAKKWLSDLKIAMAESKSDERLKQLSAATTDLYRWSDLKERSMTKYQAQIQQMNAQLVRLAVETNFAQRTALSAVQTSQSSTDTCQTAAWRSTEELEACHNALTAYAPFNPPPLIPKAD